MKRGRKPASSIDERVEKQKLIVLKDKEKMDKDIAILDDLMKKQEEFRNKKLLSAITKSNKSFEEIMAFLTENTDEKSEES